MSVADALERRARLPVVPPLAGSGRRRTAPDYGRSRSDPRTGEQERKEDERYEEAQRRYRARRSTSVVPVRCPGCLEWVAALPCRWCKARGFG